jgi:hypothetical protein
MAFEGGAKLDNASEGGNRNISEFDEMDLPPEEQEALFSIRSGTSWPMPDFLMSHPRVLEAVLKSDDGANTLQTMLKEAVPQADREEFLHLAREYMNEKDRQDMAGERGGKWSAIALAAGPVLAGLFDYASIKGGFAGISPGALYAMGWLALMGFTLGGTIGVVVSASGSEDVRKYASKLEDAMADVFGPNWDSADAAA